MFQVTYAWSLPFIKSSICLTMLRIITAKSLRITVWVAMIASIVSASESSCQPSTLQVTLPLPIGKPSHKSNPLLSTIHTHTVVGFVAVVALCQPLAYYWDTSIQGGWCASAQIITGISYLISVMAIITDWTCALVPCYVVWNLQMKSRLKLSVCAVLALGIIASAATVVRLPYLAYYNVVTNYYCAYSSPPFTTNPILLTYRLTWISCGPCH